MQKPVSLALPCLLFVLAACGQPVAPPATPKPTVTPLVRPIAPTAKLVPAAKLTWTKAIVDGGFMFQDEAVFRAYLQRSEIVAIGTLTSWEKHTGKLHVERVLRGQAGADLLLPASGGFVRKEPGKRVIALLSTNRGKMTLNSFCAAGGLYPYSKPLAAYVEEALQYRPL